jgi:hypothetical protein
MTSLYLSLTGLTTRIHICVFVIILNLLIGVVRLLIFKHNMVIFEIIVELKINYVKNDSCKGKIKRERECVREREKRKNNGERRKRAFNT